MDLELVIDAFEKEFPHWAWCIGTGTHGAFAAAVPKGENMWESPNRIQYTSAKSAASALRTVIEVVRYKVSHMK
jgi:hypothetical protein